MTDVGRFVRDARRRAGLSQAELAARARTAQSAISRIERNEISPTVRTLELIVGAAGFEVLMITAHKRRSE